MEHAKVIESKIITIKRVGLNTNPFTFPNSSYPLDSAIIPFKPTHVRVQYARFYNAANDVLSYMVRCREIADGFLCQVAQTEGTIVYNNLILRTIANQGNNNFTFSIHKVDDTLASSLDAASVLVIGLEFIKFEGY